MERLCTELQQEPTRNPKRKLASPQGLDGINAVDDQRLQGLETEAEAYLLQSRVILTAATFCTTWAEPSTSVGAQHGCLAQKHPCWIHCQSDRTSKHDEQKHREMVISCRIHTTGRCLWSPPLCPQSSRRSQPSRWRKERPTEFAASPASCKHNVADPEKADLQRKLET